MPSPSPPTGPRHPRPAAVPPAAADAAGALRVRRSLDWLNFFVANLQTGFGPFIAVYLTSHKWTPAQLGLALSVGSMVGIFGQVPGGALVDAIRRKRLAASVALAVISGSAAMFAVYPAELPVLSAEALHGFATCMLVPAIAAITLARVNPAGVAERLGRNARFGALGAAVGAGLMGAVGTYVSSRAVFWLAALLCLPAIAALQAIPPAPAAPPRAARASAREPARPGLRVLLDRRLLAFGFCAIMFHVSNAAQLPLAAVEVTRRAGDSANLVIAACLVGPQFIVAWLSPTMGRLADRWGRRPVMLIGYAALPVRALLFALSAHPWAVIVTQLLDGIGGAVFGVMLPLVAADITRGTNRFNLCMGSLGLATTVGATISTAAAGEIGSAYGTRAAFLALAAAGLLAVATVALIMPETRRTIASPG
jgi:MFS family permease